jgi:hypothetical protein
VAHGPLVSESSLSVLHLKVHNAKTTEKMYLLVTHVVDLLLNTLSSLPCKGLIEFFMFAIANTILTCKDLQLL